MITYSWYPVALQHSLWFLALFLLTKGVAFTCGMVFALNAAKGLFSDDWLLYMVMLVLGALTVTSVITTYWPVPAHCGAALLGLIIFGGGYVEQDCGATEPVLCVIGALVLVSALV
jgi:hypothetical protein